MDQIVGLLSEDSSLKNLVSSLNTRAHPESGGKTSLLFCFMNSVTWSSKFSKMLLFSSCSLTILLQDLHVLERANQSLGWKNGW